MPMQMFENTINPKRDGVNWKILGSIFVVAIVVVVSIWWANKNAPKKIAPPAPPQPPVAEAPASPGTGS